MKKNLILATLVMSSLIMTQPIFVSATDISQNQTSVSSSDIQQYPTPVEPFIFADGFSLADDAVSLDDGYRVFTLAKGNYKVLTLSDGVVYKTSTATKTIPADEEFGLPEQTVTYNTLITDSVDNISTILANEPVVTAESSFKTVSNLEATLLFFNDDAATLDDAVFACKVADLGNYLVERQDEEAQIPVCNSTVSLVENLGNNSGKFKIDFELPIVNFAGVDYEDLALTLVVDSSTGICLNNQHSGSVEFELNNLNNRVYEYYIVSTYGYEYTGTFTVDFAESSDDDSLDVSTEAPNISFQGYPNKSIKAGTPVTMKMETSNVKSIMAFNGKTLGNGTYGKSFEFTVDRNGSYYYVATTALGQITEGELTIDFFEGEVTTDLSDPINSDLVNVTDTRLQQTGFGYNTWIYIGSGVLILAGASLLVFSRRKKEADVNDKQ